MLKTIAQAFRDAPWPLRFFFGYAFLTLAISSAGTVAVGIVIGLHYAVMAFAGVVINIIVIYKLMWHRSKGAHTVTVVILAVASLFLFAETINNKLTPFYANFGFYYACIAAIYSAWALFKASDLNYWVPTLERLRWDAELGHPVPK